MPQNHADKSDLQILREIKCDLQNALNAAAQKCAKMKSKERDDKRHTSRIRKLENRIKRINRQLVTINNMIHMESVLTGPC